MHELKVTYTVSHEVFMSKAWYSLIIHEVLVAMEIFSVGETSLDQVSPRIASLLFISTSICGHLANKRSAFNSVLSTLVITL